MKKGFTLIEVLIATSLFTIAAVIASTILVNVVQLEQKSSIQNAVYHDLRILMQQLSNEVQNGTIDYEEYYNMEVIQLLGQDGNNPEKHFYGVNYGVYASRFFSPGRSLEAGVTINPADLGVECSYPTNLGADESCEIYFTNSNDLNTGFNPYDSDGEDANAFCDETVAVACADAENYVNELYLIDSTGTKKTIIGSKFMGGDDHSIAMVRMYGRDLDQNGVVDIFSCEEEYKCFQKSPGGGLKIANDIKYSFIKDKPDPQAYLEENGVSLPQKSDLEDAFIANTTQFIPISPSTINVKDLTFVINPLENPYVAFSEKPVQMHPSVTILITVGLSEEAEEDYPGEFEDFTVQTTVAAGLVGKLDSYPPVNDILKPRFNEAGQVTARDTSWIKDVFAP